jgi:hypothetical protein
MDGKLANGRRYCKTCNVRRVLAHKAKFGVKKISRISAK